MNALAMLRHEHQTIRASLDELQSTDDADHEVRRRTLERIMREMAIHELVEDDIFYPALRTHPNARRVMIEQVEAHHAAADALLARLRSFDVTDPGWRTAFGAIRREIEHHLTDVELDVLPEAGAVLDERQLNELGMRMQQRRDMAASTGVATPG